MSKRAVNLLRKMEMVYGELQRFTNSAGIRDARLFRSATSGVAKTVMTATELSLNTHYVASTATALAMTIPSAADGDAGDWISVFYTTAINNGAAQTFTTTTDTAYALGSTITRPLSIMNRQMPPWSELHDYPIC